MTCRINAVAFRPAYETVFALLRTGVFEEPMNDTVRVLVPAFMTPHRDDELIRIHDNSLADLISTYSNVKSRGSNGVDSRLSRFQGKTDESRNV